MAKQGSSSSTSSNDKPGGEIGLKGKRPIKLATPSKPTADRRGKTTVSIDDSSSQSGNEIGLKGNTGGGAEVPAPTKKVHKPEKTKKDKKVKKSEKSKKEKKVKKSKKEKKK